MSSNENNLETGITGRGRKRKINVDNWKKN